MLGWFDKKRSAREKKILKYFKKKWRIRVQNPQLYITSLTHKSYSKKRKKVPHNERLEFLGDAILDAIISEYLYLQYPKDSEGELTRFRAKIVNRTQLNHLAKKVDLPKVMRLKRGPNDRVDTIYGNGVEALIGAIFLEKGYKKTRKLVMKILIHPNLEFDKLKTQTANFKGAIIEWAQKERKSVHFNTDEIDENPLDLYKSVIIVDGQEVAEGKGKSKKEAEQMAAKEACRIILKK